MGALVSFVPVAQLDRASDYESEKDFRVHCCTYFLGGMYGKENMLEMSSRESS